MHPFKKWALVTVINLWAWYIAFLVCRFMYVSFR